MTPALNHKSSNGKAASTSRNANDSVRSSPHYQASTKTRYGSSTGNATAPSNKHAQQRNENARLLWMRDYPKVAFRPCPNLRSLQALRSLVTEPPANRAVVAEFSVGAAHDVSDDQKPRRPLDILV